MSSVYTYYKPLQRLHVIATIGLLIMIAGQIPFLVNFFLSMFRGAKAPANPWHATTLEWAHRLAPAARQLRQHTDRRARAIRV